MKTVYTTLEKMLKKYAKTSGLVLYNQTENSQAKVLKKQLHLCGKTEVSLFGKKPQRVYIASIMEHKDYVGFYSMVMYLFPKEFSLTPFMKKSLQGKSCFKIKNPSTEEISDIEHVIQKSILLFKKQNWI